jgi:hypothetical protein
MQYNTYSIKIQGNKFCCLLSNTKFIIGDEIQESYARGGQNNGKTKELRNRICVGYIERTSFGNIECSSSVCLHYVVLASVH